MERALKKSWDEHSLRYLFCDCSADSEPRSEDGETVRSPVRCLDRAVGGSPGVIVVRFAEMPLREREALVELCTVLKRNSYTRNAPLVALLHARHRKLMEDLDQAGVEYVKFAGKAFTSPPPMVELIDALSPEDLLKRQLTLVCPYLHYNPIDAGREMIVCGAYLDRLVLGGKWLHEVCECEGHLRCEYFLNPRIES